MKTQTIIFITPSQNQLHIIRQHLPSFKIVLLAKRKGDGYTNIKTFDFAFVDHTPDSCIFCNFMVDSDEPASIKTGIKAPIPGRQKRVIGGERKPTATKRARTNSNDSDSSMSHFAFSPSSSISYPFSPDSGIESENGGRSPPIAYDRERYVYFNPNEDFSASSPVYSDTTIDNDTMGNDELMPQQEFTSLVDLQLDQKQYLYGYQQVENIEEDIDINAVLEANNCTELLNIMDHGPAKEEVFEPMEIQKKSPLLTLNNPMLCQSGKDYVSNESIQTPIEVTKVPIFLQQREQIFKDSTAKYDQKSPVKSESASPIDEIESELVKDEKDDSPDMKSEASEETNLIEKIPLFLILFMLILLILKLLAAYATFDLSAKVATALSLCFSIVVFFCG